MPLSKPQRGQGSASGRVPCLVPDPTSTWSLHLWPPWCHSSPHQHIPELQPQVHKSRHISHLPTPSSSLFTASVRGPRVESRVLPMALGPGLALPSLPLGHWGHPLWTPSSFSPLGQCTSCRILASWFLPILLGVYWPLVSCPLVALVTNQLLCLITTSLLTSLTATPALEGRHRIYLTGLSQVPSTVPGTQQVCSQVQRINEYRSTSSDRVDWALASTHRLLI